ncbi:MAG: toll/interleukin-1 receptor domain-containing protein, partial [Lachnospiraceae bacterium]|nr:toll/interleukin-1 receptor domain-containing protein [Lachnospiraceae bacterium]
MDVKFIPAYRGDGKYLFVSYAHKDSEDVYPVIEALIADGYRVWYDEGIDPGEDWAEAIGSSLSKASLLMFFATKTSVKRENVMRELVFAKEHDIPVITVKIGNFVFPPETERMLLVNQVVNLSAFETFNEFVTALRPVTGKYGVREETTENN